MRVIGIDQSLSCTGVTIKELDGNLNVVDSRYYFTTSVKKHTYQQSIKPWFIGKATGFNKAYKIGEHLREIFQSMKDCAYVAMEGYSFGSKSQSLFQLGELGGVIRYLAKKNQLNLRVYEPTVIKKWATGKGAGKKAPMYTAYKEMFPNSPILSVYDSLNLKLPIEPQLSRSAGKPLCDLIDSDFIATMLCEELRVRNGIKTLYGKDDIFHNITKSKSDTLADRVFE